MNAPVPSPSAGATSGRKAARRPPRKRQHQQYRRTSAIIDERPDGKPIIFGYGRHLTKREKERVQHRILYGAVAVLLAISVVIVGSTAVYQNIIYPNQAVASVNGQGISRHDVQAVSSYYSALSTSNGGQLQQDPTALATAKLQKNLLAQLDAQQQLHLGVSNAEINARLQQDLPSMGGNAGLNRLLTLTSLSKDDYKRLFVSAQVLEDKIGDYWTHWGKNDPKYTLAEQWRYSRIQTKDAKSAQDVLTKLSRGASFAALAKTISIDTQTNTKGGDLGWQRAIDTQTDTLLPTVLPELKAMEKSHTKYKLIHTGSQYYIVTLTGHDLKHPISDTQHQQDRVTAFNAWFSPLLSSGRFVPALPADQIGGQQVTQPTTNSQPAPAATSVVHTQPQPRTGTSKK